MCPTVGVARPASVDWSWSAFWVVCPLLAALLVLALAALVALLRAERPDVPQVFCMFGAFLVRLVRRPTGSRDAARRGELDTAARPADDRVAAPTNSKDEG